MNVSRPQAQILPIAYLFLGSLREWLRDKARDHGWDSARRNIAEAIDDLSDHLEKAGVGKGEIKKTMRAVEGIESACRLYPGSFLSHLCLWP